MEVPGLSVFSSKTEECLWRESFLVIAGSAIFKNYKWRVVGVWWGLGGGQNG